MRRDLLRIIRILIILIASAVMGAGISLFTVPGGLVPGGVSGIAIIISRLTGLKVGTLSIIINIPLLAAAYIKFGRRFFADTLFALVASSAAIDIFAKLPPLTDDILACALAGGSLISLGLGIIMRCGSTTGGSDIVVKLLKRRFTYIKTGALFMTLDGMVVAVSGLVFGNWHAVIYSMLTIVVSSFTLNIVLYGADEAKLLFIVCDNYEDVINTLVDELEVGVSLINAVGGYTRIEKYIVMCAVRKQNLYKAKQLIYSCDSSAFMIVSSATAIYGMGFKSYEDSEL